MSIGIYPHSSIDQFCTRIDIESIRFEIKESISMFCEKRKRVVLAGSELFNTHYHGIDDTPTQEAYHGLKVTPNANRFNCNTESEST